MGYLHINNLYRDQMVLLFRECYALEKIDGTSANISWRDGRIWFSPGGESHDRFVKLFDAEALTKGFVEMGHPEVKVFGEAYGGKQQGQSWRYGTELRSRAVRDEIKQFQIDWNKRGCVPVEPRTAPQTVRAFLTRIEELRQDVRLVDLIEPIEVDI